jgi:excisionase family DNA binding protein
VDDFAGAKRPANQRPIVMVPVGNRFLKLKDVQGLLGVSRTTLWRWQAEHGLKVVRVGDVVRVRESDLQAFLSRHETSGAGGAQPQTVEVMP